MVSVFSSSPESATARLLLEAIVVSLLGLALLIAFIVLRRWYRGRYFRRLNQRTFALRSMWDDIVSGRVAASTWRFKPLDCEVVESALLDGIEMAAPDELAKLLSCLRSSGLLDMRIYDARSRQGSARRLALVALGRTRALEAIPTLAEALDDPDTETRIAAVRGLGRTALVEAAPPLLDRLVSGQLQVPEHALKNALFNCCHSNSRLLIEYLPQSSGTTRELLARVLGELATPELGDELLVLATDQLPEVRASAARALAKAQPSFAISVLAALAGDSEWFVRLRAVVALSSLDHPAGVRILLRALCDQNRYVRQRAAWALAQREPDLEKIFDQVAATGDRYALEAFLSELERSGGIDKVAQALEEPSLFPSSATTFLNALQAGKAAAEVAASSVDAGGHER
jgi:HEAT repeat protein